MDLDTRVRERVGHAFVLSCGLLGRHGGVEEVRLGVERPTPELQPRTMGTNVCQLVEFGTGGERWHSFTQVGSGTLNPSPP